MSLLSYTEEQFERYVRGEISESQLLGKKIDGVFEVGDEVVLTDGHDGNATPGMRGIVRRTEGTHIGLEMLEERFIGHDLNGLLDNEKGWFVPKVLAKHV